MLPVSVNLGSPISLIEETASGYLSHNRTLIKITSQSHPQILSDAETLANNLSLNSVPIKIYLSNTSSDCVSKVQIAMDNRGDVGGGAPGGVHGPISFDIGIPKIHNYDVSLS